MRRRRTSTAARWPGPRSGWRCSWRSSRWLWGSRASSWGCGPRDVPWIREPHPSTSARGGPAGRGTGPLRLLVGDRRGQRPRAPQRPGGGLRRRRRLCGHRPGGVLPAAHLHAHRHRRRALRLHAGHHRAPDPAVLRLHPLPRRLPDDDGRHRGRPARAGQGAGGEAAGRLRDDGPRLRHPGRAGGVPRAVRRRPAAALHRADRRPARDRPGAAGHRCALGRGGRPAALVVTAAVRIGRQGARRLRRGQHLAGHRFGPAQGDGGGVSRLATRLAVVVLAMLASLALAGPASAHVGGGTAGSDFDGHVTALTPRLPGVTVRVLQFGDDLELVNRSSTEVQVPGYDDEPYLRIGPNGVWRNQRSPATYINLDRYGRVTLPEYVDSRAEPKWVRLSTQPHYVWHDHRTHWMTQGLLPRVVAADPGRSHTVFDWTVPLRYGDTDARVEGVLTWTPPPSPWLVWPLYLVAALTAVAAGLLARTARPLGALMLVGAAAALWHAGATPVPALSVSSHTGAVLAAMLPALTAALVAVLGFRAAARRRGAMA